MYYLSFLVNLFHLLKVLGGVDLVFVRYIHDLLHECAGQVQAASDGLQGLGPTLVLAQPQTEIGGLLS